MPFGAAFMLDALSEALLAAPVIHCSLSRFSNISASGSGVQAQRPWLAKPLKLKAFSFKSAIEAQICQIFNPINCLNILFEKIL